MNSSTVPLLFVSFLLLISSTIAFDITKILQQHSDFSTFNSFLTQTQVSKEINRRQTITVLAVDNGAISSLSGKPKDVLKRVMSVHVVLDYYDMGKIRKLSNKSTLLTTLFQSSGVATNQQGFLNVTILSSGEISIGSASPGSDLNARVVSLVAADPYNIAVLQISNAIVPPGIEKLNSNKTSPPPSPAAIGSPKKGSAPPPASEAPASDAPIGDTPPPSGKSDSPISSPSGPASGGDSGAPDPSTAASSSSATRVLLGMFPAFVIGVAYMAAL